MVSGRDNSVEVRDEQSKTRLLPERKFLLLWIKKTVSKPI